MIVTVTGADGLLGSNIVRLLINQGHGVRVVLQPGKPSPTLDGLDIEKFTGDILDPHSLVAAFRGTQGVIHAAASTTIWPARSEIVRQVNIQGTQNVLSAAQDAKVQRFVYIGTANSFSPGTRENPGDETTGYTCGRFGLDYMDSKFEAQKLVLKAYRETGFPAITINPTFMIGPYDSTPSSGTLLIRLYQGKIPGYTPGGKCWTHVHDVAQAAVNGLSMGRLGESYIAGNINLSYREFFSLAAGVIGVNPPSLRLPKFLALGTGAAGSLWGTLTRTQPTLSLAVAKIGWEGHYYDGSKARDELAMPSTPLELAVKDCFSWLREKGYVQGRT